MYGIRGGGKGKPGGGGDFATQCLLARRFAEAGVRFIEVTHNGWDPPGNLAKSFAGAAAVFWKQ